MTLDPESDPIGRRILRVLRMVHELHKRGYQRLRISPSLAPVGCWRCLVTHAGNILRSNGAMHLDDDRDTARHTAAQDHGYFGWGDARHDTVRQLADRFVDRFPAIARLGHGRDWPYAGWYVEMLGHAEHGAFPVAYADWYTSPSFDCLPTTERTENSGLPMPPGGEAEPRPRARRDDLGDGAGGTR